MRKYLIFVLLAMFGSGAAWAALESDMTSQGVWSWIHKNLTASQLSTMVSDYEDVTAVNTLTYGECGKTVFLNSGTEFATTLPAPSAGCSFEFIVKAAPAGQAYTVVTSGGANLIDGSATVNGAAVAAVNEDTITFTASAAVSGDWVRLISDGTNWYVSGQGVAATSIAFTAT